MKRSSPRARTWLVMLLLQCLHQPAVPFAAHRPARQWATGPGLSSRPRIACSLGASAVETNGQRQRWWQRRSSEQAVTVITDPAPDGRVRKSMWAARRSCLIWSRVLTQCIKVVRLRRSGLQGDALVERRTQLAAELRDTLIQLGPTFIKIGQLLSTRVDVLAPEVIRELSQLQNQVPGFPADRAKRIVEEQLGRPVDELFAWFESEPLAAASLAQVHRAKLHNGDEVVVKVQRENLLDLFRVDLWNIQLVAALADRFDPQTEATAANWKGIARTSGDVLFREVDFNVERRAAETFASNFATFDAIKIPSTVPELSTDRVLTMEYVPGVIISDAHTLRKEGFDPVHLSNQLTTSYLEQVCRHGFFHCDPHPGNLAVDHGYPGGRLIYYDFGMMEVMEPEIKKGFVDLIFSIYENLPREACDALEAMGVLRSGVDRFSIERIARSMLETFQSTLANADNVWENQMSPEEKRAARRKRRAQLGQDLFATQADKPFLFPPKWTFVFRAFSTIDGIGKGLDSGYDLTKISQPYLRELSNLRDGSTATTAIKEVGRRLGLRPKDIAQAVTQPRSVAELAASVRRIEQGDVKLRVRAIEVERTLRRMEERQTLIGCALGAAVGAQALVGALTAPLWQRLPLIVGTAKLAWEAWRAQARMTAVEVQRKRFANEGDEQYDQADVTPGLVAQDEEAI